MKSGLQWYDAAWRLGTVSPSNAGSSPNKQEPMSDLDWYVNGWQLGTSAQIDDVPQNKLNRAIARIWHRVAAFLSVSDDPRLTEVTDSSGQSVWSAYDPRTGQHIKNLPEHEMRVWLEERFHQ